MSGGARGQPCRVEPVERALYAEATADLHLPGAAVITAFLLCRLGSVTVTVWTLGGRVAAAAPPAVEGS